MARTTQPKIKLMRKIGQDLGLKSNPLKSARRLNVLPGFHGHKGRRKVSDYGTQLTEKQKVKIIYGIMEKQFHKYYVMAAKNPTATGAALLAFLERRLDNVVYRLGLAPTRAAARQLVSHGNVQINQKKVTIPSYLTKVGEVITISSTAQKIPYIATLLKEKHQGLPQWLQRQQNSGKINRLPAREDITDDINEQLIVEFYSR